MVVCVCIPTVVGPSGVGLFYRTVEFHLRSTGLHKKRWMLVCCRVVQLTCFFPVGVGFEVLALILEPLDSSNAKKSRSRGVHGLAAHRLLRATYCLGLSLNLDHASYPTTPISVRYVNHKIEPNIIYLRELQQGIWIHL